MADLRRAREAVDITDLGWARFPETEERIPYGRFRNVYLYITEECQLRCGHCYMGERLDRATMMPLAQIRQTLKAWRQLGGSKLTLLGGEPTLHHQFEDCVRAAYELGYEKIILTTNGLKSARTKLAGIPPAYLSYIQISLDGGSAESHDKIRGPNSFKYAMETAEILARSGHDVRLICTVNKLNVQDCLNLIDISETRGFTLVKYHVFSSIGTGRQNSEWALSPKEWLTFIDLLKIQRREQRNTQVWYQPTYSRVEDVAKFTAQGYRGCVGRTMDRISIFPDGRCYICSFLFDTDQHYAEMKDGIITLNKKENEVDLFYSTLSGGACGDCKLASGCSGGCPAERLVEGASACDKNSGIVSICRLWKSDVIV